MRRFMAVSGVFGLLFLFTACTPTEQATVDCVQRDHVISPTGTQSTQYKLTHAFPADGAVNATGLEVTTSDSYPFYVTENAGPDVCIVGGLVQQTLDHDTTDWATWKVGAGFLTKSARTEVVGMELNNVGDGFRFGNAGTEDWELRGVKVTRAHDDCVENDQMHSGLIDDSLFDGCYVFYSSRGAPGGSAPDGLGEMVTITNSLVRMESMPSAARNGSGHGPIWKLGNGTQGTGRSPSLAVHNTIFRVDATPALGSLTMPQLNGEGYLDEADCSNNTIVWGGAGPVPTALMGYATDYPNCFTVTTDTSVWDNAVATWEADHDYS